MNLAISRTQRQQLLDWANVAKSEECCGLLLGNKGVVERVMLTVNVADDPAREFEIEPSALIAAEKDARAGGPEILGYFHSHPNGAAEPSLRDARMAADDGRWWLIIAGDRITCWRPIRLASGDIAFANEGAV